MPSRIKSALFVDFDNIFIGLKADDLRAAEDFGRGVNKWLQWIGSDMALPDGGEFRDILVRRCYGNPETFAEYRGYFTRNGFSVVDCPPLTTRGKNSADIVMVMDILDILAHPTRFDEFIIMSADADFTPLVLRLRMHDRRTVAIVAGNAAAAYRASCDLVVSDDEFVSEALRLPQAPAPRPAPRPGPPAPAVPPALLEAIARRVYEEASAGGAVEGSRLPEIFREFKEFTARTDWLGFLTLRALTEKLVSLRPELRLTEGQVWSVMVEVPRPAPVAAGPAPVPNGNGNGNGDLAELRAAMIQAVRQMVRKAEAPMVSAAVAQKVIAGVGQAVLDTRWAGAGTFRNFIESVADLGLGVLWTPEEGYIYDPERHAPPQPRRGDMRPANLEGLSEELASFIRRIADVSDTPRLSPHQYAVLFEVIAKEVQRTPYELTYTSRVVRDQMLERGETVSRQATAFVLRGVTFSGYRFRRTGVSEAPELAHAFRGNVLNLLRSAQVVLADGELALLDQWLLEPTTHAARPSADAPAAGVEEDAGSVAGAATAEEDAAPSSSVAEADAPGRGAAAPEEDAPPALEAATAGEDVSSESPAAEEEAASTASAEDHAPESVSDEPGPDAGTAFEPEASPQPGDSPVHADPAAWNWPPERGGDDEWSGQSPADDGAEPTATADAAADVEANRAWGAPAVDEAAAAPSDDVLRAWFDTWAETTREDDGSAEPAPEPDPIDAPAAEGDGTAWERREDDAEGEWQPERAPYWADDGALETQSAESDHDGVYEADQPWPDRGEPAIPAEPSTEEPPSQRDDIGGHPLWHAGAVAHGEVQGENLAVEPAAWLADDRLTAESESHGAAADTPATAWTWYTPPPADAGTPAAAQVDDAPAGDGPSATADPDGEVAAPTAEGAAVGSDAEMPPPRSPGWIQWPPFGPAE